MDEEVWCLDVLGVGCEVVYYRGTGDLNCVVYQLVWSTTNTYTCIPSNIYIENILVASYTELARLVILY